MASQKKSSTPVVTKKTTVIKIAEKVGEIAGRIVNTKDQLIGLAGNALSSVTGAAARNSNGKKVLPQNSVAPSKSTTRKPRPAAKKSASTPNSKAPVKKRAVTTPKVVALKTAEKATDAKRAATPRAVKKAAVKTVATTATTASKPKAAVPKPAVAAKKLKK